MLRFELLGATFKKDHDAFGKQDPYIVVHYNGVLYFESYVIKEGGLEAEWDEEFDIDFNLIAGNPESTLVLTAYDKDKYSSDFIGQTNKINAL